MAINKMIIDDLNAELDDALKMSSRRTDDTAGSTAGSTAGDGWREGLVNISVSSTIYRDTFAVHKMVGNSDQYVITHIPTGFCLDNATGTFVSEGAAQDAVLKIWDCCEDWQSLNNNSDPDYRRSIGLAIRRRLKEADGDGIQGRIELGCKMLAAHREGR